MLLSSVSFGMTILCLSLLISLKDGNKIVSAYQLVIKICCFAAVTVGEETGNLAMQSWHLHLIVPYKVLYSFVHNC